ncbi:MAG: hypothetical protein KDI32_08310 [Pseudomonadales bacterium]|nr:hypothetical protein [Pseudomonadales bacterium]
MATTPETKRQTYTVEAIPSDVKNGVFLGNPMLDNLVSCVIAMGSEMWTTKRRLKVLEAVMSKAGVTSEMVEKYQPTEQELAAWEQERGRFIEMTLGSLANDGIRGVGADYPARD